ncbi:hypothetical protein [Methylocystis suflitae]|uniref:hypothetical protein n=1 Tax=Methylocystis suflitae TaxID=2951405 RepID=UPI00210E7816|nr:hypothetical protein [Methylocystis suflitae]MCQ4188848.1 hypothetical protein [Methylocystis suflitae]
MADETFLLGEALSRYETPENRSKREAAVQDHSNLLTDQTAAKPVNEEIAVWQEKIAAAVQRRREFEARVSEGLLDQLQREGCVAATGHIDGLHNPKITIPADVWRRGAWEFQPRANFARGGDPVIEIHGLRIVETVQTGAEIKPTAIVEEVEARDSWRDLPEARDAELEAFLNTLAPCNEDEARDAAETHFQARITRNRFRKFAWPKRRRGRQSSVG